MDRKILKCINTIDEFDIEELDRLQVGIEIQDFTEPNLTDEEVKHLTIRYNKLFSQFNGVKSLHGPFLDLKPASPDLEIRRVSYNKYLRTLKVATQLDMDYVIFHSQINPYLNDPYLIKLNNIQTRDFFHEILDELKDFKGTILIENIFEPTPDLIKERIDMINIPNIKNILDIGHAKLGSVSLEKWVKELKNHLVYVHLHSNNGVHDLHQVPSEIEILALKDLFRKYDLNPVVSLEYKSNDPNREIEILRS
ncbi:sugar phosphate isomerase/epimerase [Tissierella creatinini]|nr:sugar phosphate isomerase/epimerase [Tissierella creatinini]TJX65597.1 sugar phosphate isomerase/epimerase [Soehngenia saccharolytica]